MKIHIEHNPHCIRLTTTYKGQFYSKLYVGYRESDTKGLFKTYCVEENAKTLINQKR